jgi:hypothetical protein
MFMQLTLLFFIFAPSPSQSNDRHRSHRQQGDFVLHNLPAGKYTVAETNFAGLPLKVKDLDGGDSNVISVGLRGGSNSRSATRSCWAIRSPPQPPTAWKTLCSTTCLDVKDLDGGDSNVISVGLQGGSNSRSATRSCWAIRSPPQPPTAWKTLCCTTCLRANTRSPRPTLLAFLWTSRTAMAAALTGQAMTLLTRSATRSCWAM